MGSVADIIASSLISQSCVPGIVLHAIKKKDEAGYIRKLALALGLGHRTNGISSLLVCTVLYITPLGPVMS